MTLKECYEAMGGNYDEVISRLRSEALVRKFAIRFLDDDSYMKLQQALEAQNGDDAFLAAHTIKGVSQNLGFTRLFEASNALTEALRGRQLPADPQLVQDLADVYQKTAAAIREMAAG